MERFYPIGTPGTPWSDDDRAVWRASQRVQRSYRDNVRARLEALGPAWEVASYGALPVDPERYPLLCAKPARATSGAPWALVTGGVHGYESSGVHGALAVLDEVAPRFEGRVNLVVAPCVSPWGYERIHRWNADAVDPNRAFVPDSPSPEAASLMAMVDGLRGELRVHVDLHETTDSDEAEFRPARAARDGLAHRPGHVPDGFYTVADAARPEPAFQRAVVDAVASVTHIAPADAEGRIIGAEVTQPGVIHYDAKPLGLCMSMTEARFRTTTEVYPDSARVTPALCVRAQVAAVTAALQHAL